MQHRVFDGFFFVHYDPYQKKNIQIDITKKGRQAQKKKTAWVRFNSYVFYINERTHCTFDFAH